mmetsp:Transcript_18616/g.55770  ORF Transcript_18616/g.55770 Transcript_18616/m.55770 type:complete len:449 (-) Transcript_18616:97-1443(-)
MRQGKLIARFIHFGWGSGRRFRITSGGYIQRVQRRQDRKVHDPLQAQADLEVSVLNEHVRELGELGAQVLVESATGLHGTGLSRVIVHLAQHIAHHHRLSQFLGQLKVNQFRRGSDLCLAMNSLEENRQKGVHNFQFGLTECSDRSGKIFSLLGIRQGEEWYNRFSRLFWNVESDVEVGMGHLVLTVKVLEIVIDSQQGREDRGLFAQVKNAEELMSRVGNWWRDGANLEEATVVFGHNFELGLDRKTHFHQSACTTDQFAQIQISNTILNAEEQLYGASGLRYDLELQVDGGLHFTRELGITKVHSKLGHGDRAFTTGCNLLLHLESILFSTLQNVGDTAHEYRRLKTQFEHSVCAVLLSSALFSVRPPMIELIKGDHAISVLIKLVNHLLGLLVGECFSNSKCQLLKFLDIQGFVSVRVEHVKDLANASTRTRRSNFTAGTSQFLG